MTTHSVQHGHRFWNLLGIAIFGLGILLGNVFTGLTVWSDLESAGF